MRVGVEVSVNLSLRGIQGIGGTPNLNRITKTYPEEPDGVELGKAYRNNLIREQGKSMTKETIIIPSKSISAPSIFH